VKPLDVYHQAVAFGLRLEPSGDRLLVFGERCPSDFADVLRQHKRELLDLLEAKSVNLPPDCAPWLHTARQILAGEFDDCDSSTRESLTIGLRNIRHPSCQRALGLLESTNRKAHRPN
jgi:hypothetical protein